MVVSQSLGSWSATLFQYSLCRVVLMVLLQHSVPSVSSPVSVLALSSRFDGLQIQIEITNIQSVSVLALSSRFDGHLLLVAQ